MLLTIRDALHHVVEGREGVCNAADTAAAEKKIKKFSAFSLTAVQQQCNDNQYGKQVNNLC